MFIIIEKILKKKKQCERIFIAVELRLHLFVSWYNELI